MVSVILLAAGESKRMGRPKLLLPFDNGTILQKTTDNLLKSRVDEVIVVVGYQ
ncbi:NTP transferase domain-containing protein, partial [Chloroflexota bacterium]